MDTRVVSPLCHLTLLLLRSPCSVLGITKLNTTDAIIYATAQMHDPPLLTCDAHFNGLPGVEWFEKADGG